MLLHLQIISILAFGLWWLQSDLSKDDLQSRFFTSCKPNCTLNWSCLCFLTLCDPYGPIQRVYLVWNKGYLYVWVVLFWLIRCKGVIGLLTGKIMANELMQLVKCPERVGCGCYLIKFCGDTHRLMQTLHLQPRPNLKWVFFVLKD